MLHVMSCDDQVRANTALRGERIDVAQFAIVPVLDMAGARGAVIAARTIVFGD
jgi:glucokinase